MTSTCQVILPSEKFRLEEINMPEELASALAGQAVDVEVLPQAPAGTCRLDLDDAPDGLPFLVGDDGIVRNGYWPASCSADEFVLSVQVLDQIYAAKRYVVPPKPFPHGRPSLI
jgi:hypothetical protein